MSSRHLKHWLYTSLFCGVSYLIIICCLACCWQKTNIVCIIQDSIFFHFRGKTNAVLKSTQRVTWAQDRTGDLGVVRLQPYPLHHPVYKLQTSLSVKTRLQYILFLCHTFLTVFFLFSSPLFSSSKSTCFLKERNVKPVHWDWTFISGSAKPTHFWLMGWDLFVQLYWILMP